MRRGGRGKVVVLFAGLGGACTGMAAALGRSPDVAINHDELALRVHAANHPDTLHLTEDVWHSPPRSVVGNARVDDLWASPDCTHFSRAKGGKPKEKGIRSLAHVIVRWAREVRPTRIYVENVPEFLQWGPLDEEGVPIPERKGETFHQWLGALELLGYRAEWRVLSAADYGTPTSRKRLFIVLRCDGRPIVWPEPTHGPGRASPYRTAAECIDWSRPCPSIFLTKEEGRALGVNRPLAPKTMERIAKGIDRFVLRNPRPFIVGVGGRAGQTPPTPVDAPVGTITAKNDRALVTPIIASIDHQSSQHGVTGADAPMSTTTTKARHALVAPTLIQTGYGEREGQAPRVLDLHQPLGTVVATGTKHALVAAFLAKHFGGVVGVPFDGRPLDTVTAKDHHALAAATLVKLRGECHGSDVTEPMPTVTAGGTHVAEVRAFLMAYYSSGGQWADPRQPMPTVVAKHRLGLVTVHGVDYEVVDIGMRMLWPDELARAQFGRFADDYDLSAATTKADQVRLIGNSVCPEVAEALVRANAGGAERRRTAA